MRDTTRATLNHYLTELDVSGDVLEIGGHTLGKCAIDAFPAPRYKYHDLNLEASDIPNTIIADITDCREQIADDSFDVVISCDVFEHIDRPWLAASEIARILKPGGIVVTRTVWAWRNHPCPIDYWRFSAECLEFLFQPLECLEKGYDLSERRSNHFGMWAGGGDSVPIDALGGFRDNWAVYTVHRKGPGPSVPQFKYTDHPEAAALRMDTQGTVTNPKLLGIKPPPDPLNVEARLTAMDKRIAAMSKNIESIARAVTPTATTEKSLRHRLASEAPGAAKLYRRVRKAASGK